MKKYDMCRSKKSMVGQTDGQIRITNRGGLMIADIGL